jgi:hypothetical protein
MTSLVLSCNETWKFCCCASDGMGAVILSVMNCLQYLKLGSEETASLLDTCRWIPTGRNSRGHLHCCSRPIDSSRQPYIFKVQSKVHSSRRQAKTTHTSYQENFVDLCSDWCGDRGRRATVILEQFRSLVEHPLTRPHTHSPTHSPYPGSP